MLFCKTEVGVQNFGRQESRAKQLSVMVIGMSSLGRKSGCAGESLFGPMMLMLLTLGYEKKRWCVVMGWMME